MDEQVDGLGGDGRDHGDGDVDPGDGVGPPQRGDDRQRGDAEHGHDECDQSGHDTSLMVLFADVGCSVRISSYVGFRAICPA